MNLPELRWPERMARLPSTLDRFRATCVYFDIKFPPFLAGSIDAQKWVSWGSLSALTSIPEVFAREMEKLGFHEEWKTAPERLFLRDHELLSILKELRNYETHLEFLGRRRNSEMDSGAIVSTQDHRSFFFGVVSYSSLSELRNIRQGRSPVTPDSVTEFNHLTESYSVADIIDMALDVLSENLEVFALRIGVPSA